MSEALAIVSGTASFAAQVFRSIQALRNLQNGEIDCELSWLAGCLENLKKALVQLGAVRGLAGVADTVKQCQARYERIEQRLQKLLKELPAKETKPKRSLRGVGRALSGQLTKDIDDIQSAINGIVAQLNLTSPFLQINQLAERPLEDTSLINNVVEATEDLHEHRAVFCDTSNVTQGLSTSSIEADGSRTSDMPILPRSRQHVCGERKLKCANSRHLIKTASGRFWGFEYTPLSSLLAKSRTTRCSSILLRLQLRVALSQYDISRAIVLRFDFMLAGGSLSLRNSLRMPITVPYTSPGFEAIWRCQRGAASFEDTRTRLVELSQSDPTFKDHRDPMGKSYIQTLIRTPWRLGRIEDQFSLLHLLAKELGLTLEKEDQSFLVTCANWIGEGPHLDLLSAILTYLFDPIAIDCPVSDQWPVTCSPDWISERHTQDPFFINYIALLVKGSDSLGFAGSTILQNAVLTGSTKRIQAWLAKHGPIQDDFNFLGQTPLHLAVGSSASLFRLVLDNSTDLDAPDRFGTTPLMYAAAMGQAEHATDLIRCGAKLNIKDKRNRDFVSYAIARGQHIVVMAALNAIKIEYGKEGFQIYVSHAITTTLCGFPSLRDDETQLFLTELYGLADDVNFTFRDGNQGVTDNNLMHYVVDLPQAEALRASGYTLWNQQNSHGNLALSSLAKYGNPHLIQFCLENGADAQHRNKKKRTVLFDIAKQWNCFELSRLWDVMDSTSLLLNAGVDVLASDDCRCSCSPQGCNITSFFQYSFANKVLGGRDRPSLTWVLEWTFLAEEWRGVDAARAFLLLCLRRLNCDDEDLAITHVCCHRGRSEDFSFFGTPATIEDDDISEILSEEQDLIEALEERMEALSLRSLDDLRKVWMLSMKKVYENELEHALEQQAKHTTKFGGAEDSEVSSHELPMQTHSVDYVKDEFVSNLTIPPSLFWKVRPFSHYIGPYALWLEHERTRANTSPFYALHKEGWYDRRIACLVELMAVMEINADEVAAEMKNLDRTMGGIKEVDILKVVKAFLHSVKGREPEDST